MYVFGPSGRRKPARSSVTNTACQGARHQRRHRADTQNDEPRSTEPPPAARQEPLPARRQASRPRNQGGDDAADPYALIRESTTIYQVETPSPRMQYLADLAAKVNSAVDADAARTDRGRRGEERRVLLLPNRRQDDVLRGWFGTFRWTYNAAVDLIQNRNVPRDLEVLREKCVDDANFAGTDRAWVLDTPYAIREEALRDVLRAYDTNIAKQRTDPKHRFKIKFRSKKEASASIVVHHGDWRAGVMHPQWLGAQPLRSQEPIPEVLPRDFRITRSHYGDYHLCYIESDDPGRRKRTGRTVARRGWGSQAASMVRREFARAQRWTRHLRWA